MVANSMYKMQLTFLTAASLINGPCKETNSYHHDLFTSNLKKVANKKVLDV